MPRMPEGCLKSMKVSLNPTICVPFCGFELEMKRSISVSFTRVGSKAAIALSRRPRAAIRSVPALFSSGWARSIQANISSMESAMAGSAFGGGASAANGTQGIVSALVNATARE